MRIKYGSVCSGIEAATVAWHSLGWEAAWLSEIEAFPSAVLAHHYPDVPNLGDMTKYEEWNNDPIDVLVGGTPCQSFSVAGLRKGLDDQRGNLMLTFAAIARKYRPVWVVWENVPGVLSSDGGRDFASLLGVFSGQHVKCPPDGWSNSGIVPGINNAYGLAWRVLDAQYFGVAQRRRRVFVVGHLGSWQRAAAVLFERNSLLWNPAPSREKREEVAGGVRTGIASGSDPDLMATLCAKDNEKWGCNQWVKEGKAIIQPSYGIPGNWIGSASENGGNAVEPMHDIAPCLTNTDRHGVEQPIAFKVRCGCEGGGKGYLGSEETAFTLSTTNDQHIAQPIGAFKTLTNINHAEVNMGMQVRRLTPVECERLQGFPDNYTNIPWREKDESPDGPRYKALGNSMAVPVMKWIGERIQMVEDLCKLS